MKNFTSVTLSVFAKPEDDAVRLKDGLLALIPLNLEEEKIPLEDQKALGFNERTIHIFTVTLGKDRHVNAFIDFLMGKMNSQQKRQLLDQAESRLDADLVFFIRFDKELWLQERVLQLTDSGACYHLKLNVAAFPRKRDVALGIVTKVFKDGTA